MGLRGGKKEDPAACGTGPGGCCFFKREKLPVMTASHLKTIVAGVVTGGQPTSCDTQNATRHMDTTGGGAGILANVSSWEACRALCCETPSCGTYTYVNGSAASNHKT